MTHSPRNIFWSRESGSWHWRLGRLEKGKYRTKRDAATDYVHKLMSTEKHMADLLLNKEDEQVFRMLGITFEENDRC